jgi:hypothetical protein
MASNDLFGTKFQDLIGTAFKGQLVSMTLKSVTAGTRNPSDPLAGTSPTSVDVATEGVLEAYHDYMLAAGLVETNDQKALILAKPLGAVVPKIGDSLTVEGTTYRVVDVKRDPAIATYTLQIRA